MKRLYILLFIYLFSGFSDAQINKSRMSRYGFEVNFRPKVYYNTFVSYKDGLKLELSLNIQNDILQFKKVNEKFKAKYEISINIKDMKEEETFYADSWNETIEIDNFLNTNATDIYQNSRRTFKIDLNPGKYLFFVELRDAQTGNNLFSKRNLEIKDQSKEKIKLSKFVFVDNKNKLDKDIKISSSKSTIELTSSPKILIEYATLNPDSLRINSKLYKVEETTNALLYNKSYSVYSDTSFNYYIEEIDNSVLEEGEYILKHELKQAENIVTMKDSFNVVWYDKPTYLYKYDLALRPMIYLISEEEYEYAEDLSIEELEVWFRKYWKEKDDKPETKFNEVQFEFYDRVQKSIDRYSLRFKEGWRTARGETLILYGEPNDIDRYHHVTNSKPYEIWYYSNLNKKITFVDKLENEDFKLVSIENIED